MKDIPISKRLKKIAEYIPNGSVLADIGSDHAYLPCYAFLQGRITKAIAGEVNEGPLQSARESIDKYGLTAHISARLGDGLAVISKGEANVITIAGMGGELICTILSAGKDRLTDQTTLILQPNVAERQVREWLVKEMWKIASETIIEEDGHIYEIIVAGKAAKPIVLSKFELMFGPFLLQQRNDAFIKKWQSELKKRERILQSLRHASSASDTGERRRALLEEMTMIKEVIK